MSGRKALFIAALLAIIAVRSGMASEPAADPDALYKQIAQVERILPSDRSVAQSVWLGQAYAATGRMDEAYTQAQLAIEKSPNDSDARMLLGDALLQKGKYVEALSAYNRVAQQRPDSAAAQLKRSQVLAAMGLPREAEAAHGLYRTLSRQRTP